MEAADGVAGSVQVGDAGVAMGVDQQATAIVDASAECRRKLGSGVDAERSVKDVETVASAIVHRHEHVAGTAQCEMPCDTRNQPQASCVDLLVEKAIVDVAFDFDERNVVAEATQECSFPYAMRGIPDDANAHKMTLRLCRRACSRSTTNDPFAPGSMFRTVS